MVACGDGRQHSIKCPAADHPGDRSGRNTSVQLMPDGGWMLKCFSHGCSYESIAEGLGLELPKRSRGRSSYDRWLIAVYDHPDGRPRKVYRRDWPLDFPESPAFCCYPVDGEPCNSVKPHKHIWGPLSPKGTHLLLWGSDNPDNWLLVVEGEKAAGALVISGVNAQGYTPTTWRGGAKAVKRVDWSRAAGRKIILWPDNHADGLAAMEAAAQQTIAAGAVELQMVDLSAVEIPEGGDAADVRPEELMAVVLSGSGYDSPPRPAAAEDKPDLGRVRLQVDFKTLDEYLIPAATKATDEMLAVRFLRDHGDDMVGAFYPTPPKETQPPCDLYRATLGGLVERTDGVIGKRLSESADRYHAALDTSRMTSGEAKIVFAHGRAIRSQSAIAKVRGMLDAAYQDIASRGFADSLGGYRHVPAETVNADLRVLGAPNGVIDLETGKLLSPKSAMSRLISWTIRDPYEPDARHNDVDKLTEHLATEDSEWLWQAFGYALRGIPSRRAYMLRGEPRGGKSTMLDAIRCALGPPYGSVVPAGALGIAVKRGGAPTPELLQFCGPRIMIDNEIRHGQLDWGLMKMLASGDAMLGRGLYHDYDRPREVTATMFFALNNNVRVNLGLQDEALYDRIRVLRYPKPPREDKSLRERVKHVAAIRQAVVARLIAYCVKTDAPPEDVPNVRQARADARAESIGDAGQWLLDHVVESQEVYDRLSASDLWTAAVEASGELSTTEKVWGKTKDQIYKLFRDLYRLPPARAMWLPDKGKTTRAWQGVRLATRAEIRAKQGAEMDGTHRCIAGS